MAIVDLRRLTRSAALALLAALSSPMSAYAETVIHFTLDRKIDGPTAPSSLPSTKATTKPKGSMSPSARRAARSSPSIALPPAATKWAWPTSICSSGSATASPTRRLKAVFVLFDKPTYALIARKSRGITAPNDLEGKRLGRTGRR